FTGDNITMPNTTVNNQTTAVDGALGGVTNGTLPIWDMSVDTLKADLHGGALDFFFNLNQTKSSNDATYLATPQDMLAYLKVTLTSADGKTSQSVFLDGNHCTG